MMRLATSTKVDRSAHRKRRFVAARERWLRFCTEAEVKGDPEPAFADLAVRYAEAHRFYHTLEHVLACLAELDRARHLCSAPAAAELALWFHDAVYDPQADDNEERSAALLRRAAAGMGVGEKLAADAAGLVLATDHRRRPERAGSRRQPRANDAGSRRGLPADADLVCDIDLAILGAPAAAFDAYERAVRREHALLSDAEWRAGRRRVLEAFLARPRIYATAEMAARYELAARRNLGVALARLSGSPAGPPARQPPR